MFIFEKVGHSKFVEMHGDMKIERVLTGFLIG
jgi:hypothetical protein